MTEFRDSDVATDREQGENEAGFADHLLTTKRGYKFRLMPSPDQAAAFRQLAGATRLVYNLALEQRRDHWRQFERSTGRRLNWAAQSRELTDLRAAFPWLGDLPRECAEQALRDLEKAYANFFAGRANYPTPRRKGSHDRFRFNGRSVTIRIINLRWAAVRLPSVGWVKFRRTRDVHGKIENVTIAPDGAGWHATFCATRQIQVPSNDNPAVGIDRGIATTLALSSGETMDLPRLSELHRRIERARRVLARRQRGSRRREAQRKRLARLCRRQASIRRDWLHRASTDIARRYGLVALERLNIAGMSARGRGKRGLNRSILEQGWGAFASFLAYKLDERGGTLVHVDPRHTSQTCSACGTVDRESRKSQATFVCTSCGFALNADHNAAINILRRSTAAMPVEGGGCAPCEAGTSRAAA